MWFQKKLLKGMNKLEKFKKNLTGSWILLFLLNKAQEDFASYLQILKPNKILSPE
jgi:hypothetical protein